MTNQDLDRIRFVTRHFNDLQGLRYWVPLGLLTLSVGGTTYFENRAFVILRAALFLGAVLLFFGARRYYRTYGEVERQPVLPAAELSTVSVFSPAGPPQRLADPQLMTPAATRSFLITIGTAFALFLILQAISPSFRVDADESLVQSPWLAMDVVLSVSTDRVRSSADLLPMSPSSLKSFYGQMMYTLFGSFFLGMWIWRERRPSQSYYLAFGILLLGLSILGASQGFLLGQQGEIARTLSVFQPAVVHLWLALFLCGSSTILAGLLDHWQLARTLGRQEKQP